MSDRVLITRTGPVAHVRLNRPEKRNGLDLAAFEALVAAGDALAADRSVRAVVLSGEGPAFCAGLDWGAFLAMGEEGASRLLHREPGASPANLAQRAAWVWRELPVPVIAAIHGACFGGGLQIALAADVRLVAADAKLSVMELRYGIIPDMTATRTLSKLVRADVALDLILSARELSGAEAVTIGLGTRVAADPIAEALALAADYATRSPHAIQAAKHLFWGAEDLDVRDALALESAVQETLLRTPNQMEAVMAAMQRRTPVFEDPV